MWKRWMALLLTFSCCAALVSCGGEAEETGISAEQLALAEAYARAGAGRGRGEYSSYEHIRDIIVAIPADPAKTVAELLEEATGGELYYFSDEALCGRLEAIVFENDDGDDLLVPDDSVLLMSGVAVPAAVPESSEGVAADLPEDDGEEEIRSFLLLNSFADTAASVEPDLREISYRGYTYRLDTSKSTVERVKWFLAEKELAFESWQAEQGEALVESLAAADAVLAGVSEETLYRSEAYALQRKSDALYEEYCTQKAFVDYLRRLVGALEKVTDGDYSAAYRQVLDRHNHERAVWNIVSEKAGYQAQLAAAETAAAEDLARLAAEIDEIRTSSADYVDDDRYLRIRVENPSIGAYEDLRASITLLEGSIAALDAAFAEQDESLRGFVLELEEIESDYTVDYWQARVAYMRAVLSKESFEQEHAEELSRYDTRLAEIKETVGASYQQDVEYMKNELLYAAVVEERAAKTEAVAQAERAVDEVRHELEEARAEIEEKQEERATAIRRGEDEKKLSAFAADFVRQIGEINAAEHPEETSALGEIGGFYIVKISAALLKELDDSRDVKKSTVSSGGGSGSSSGRICAESGCTRKAVTSGDSVYCAAHSNHCLQCGCYIDGDAMYCLDCLREALS